MPKWCNVNVNQARRDMLLLCAALLLGSLVLFIHSAPIRDEWTPLPWDMSQHYLGAVEVRDALRAGSPTALFGALRASDLYPPGHSVALGIWLLVGGEGRASQQLFQLFTLWCCILALWLCARKQREVPHRDFFCGASFVLLMSAPIAALAGTFMVEVPAIALALGAIGLMADPRLSERRRAVALAATMAGCLLTKYNIGLPLLPAAAALGAARLLRGDRRTGFALLAAALSALAIWALYLTWQIGGWDSFFAFARNRANSQQWSAFARLAWYVKWYATECCPGAAYALVVGLLALIGLIAARGRLAVAALTYLTVSLIALVRHPYVLDRNLLSSVAVIVLPAALGASALRARLAGWRPYAGACAGAALLVAGGIALAASPAAIHRQQAKLFKSQSQNLASLSHFVVDQFRTVDSCRVIGTFNEFSPAWVTILWGRAHAGRSGAVYTDFPYPLADGRETLDARPDAIYGQRVEAWASTSVEQKVITLDVLDASDFDTEDYRLWNRWKRNDISAIASSPWLQRVATFATPAGGVTARVFVREHEPLRYLGGWGPQENWGRWALEQVAQLSVPPALAPRRLVFRTAGYEGLRGIQECRVAVDGVEVGRFAVSGAPWRWEDHAVAIPARTGDAVQLVELRFTARWPGNDRDPTLRALPFASITLEKAP